MKAELLENYNEKENQDVLEEIHISPEVKDDDKPKDEKKGFKGLIGKFARSFVLATSLITGSLATAEQASAEDKPAVKNVEKKENVQEKQKAIELLKKLYDLDPKGESKAQDRLKKYRIAENIINIFALEQKLGFPDRKKQEKISGYVSPDDMKKALKTLDANLNNFIEKEFEEKDKKLTKEERNKKLEEVMKSNLGISYLKEKLSLGVQK